MPRSTPPGTENPALPPTVEGSPDRTAPPTPSELAYRLRLCVDLAIQTLLLTLGAAATDPVFARLGQPNPQDGPQQGAPDAVDLPDQPDDTPLRFSWERWLQEDVDVVHQLSRELIAQGGGLPVSLSNAAAAPSTLAVLDRLGTFHAHIRELLVEVEELRGSAAQPPVAAGVTAASSAHARAVAQHCHRRLTELQALRIEVSELLATRGAALGYPPGEFLG